MRPVPNRPVQKLQIVDIVRSFSILAVLLMHLFLSGAVKAPGNPWIKGFWFAVSKNGTYGVFLFFVVSGFLITRMLATTSTDLFHPSWRNFYVRRIARLFPLLFLTVLSGAVMVYFFEARSPAYIYCFKDPRASFDLSFWSCLSTFSFNWYRIFHDKVSPHLGLHWDVLWSLSIEEQFYLFYPLALGWLRTEKKFLGLLAFFILLAPLGSFTAYEFRPDSFLIFMNSATAFGSIALGALLYVLSNRYGKLIRGHIKLKGGLCILGAMIMFTVYFGTSIRDPRDCAYGPFSISLGLFFFLLGALQLDLFESKKLRVFSLPGKVSYGAYLWHACVLYFLAPLFFGMDASSCFVLFILATVGVSWISYRFFEEPANRWVRRVLGPWMGVRARS